jgi:hypothetical protein
MNLTVRGASPDFRSAVIAALRAGFPTDMFTEALAVAETLSVTVRVAV